MAVNIHITIIELNALHTKRQNLFQELDAVIHLLMEAKHWGLRKSRNATSLNSRFKSLDTLKVKIISVTFRRVIRTNHKKASDRKSGSAGMPRPMSYAVFCLKKQNPQVRCVHSRSAQPSAKTCRGGLKVSPVALRDCHIAGAADAVAPPRTPSSNIMASPRQPP